MKTQNELGIGRFLSEFWNERTKVLFNKMLSKIRYYKNYEVIEYR